MTIYTLWDTESARRLGEYTDIENALDVVRRDIERGKGYLWNSGALVQLTEEKADEHIVLFEDEALLERARGTSGGMSPASDTQPGSAVVSPAPRVRSSGATSRSAVASLGFDTAGLKPFGGIDLGKLAASGMIADAALKSFADIHILSLDTMLLGNPYDTVGIADTFLSASAVVSLGKINWTEYFVGHHERVRDDLAVTTTDPAITPASLGSAHAQEVVELASEVAQRAMGLANTGTYVFALRDHPEIPFVYRHSADANYLAAVAPEDESGDVMILAEWRVEDGKLIG